MPRKYILNNIIIEDSIYLIGICSVLDNFNLVYKLNKQLNLNFVRSKKDIDLPKEKAYYSHFIAKNKSKEIIYDFFSNKFKKISSPDKLNKLDLFNYHFSKEVYLLKEYKEADYFLKSTDQKYHQKIINSIRNIPQISIIYNVNSNEIKNKENLIFN